MKPKLNVKYFDAPVGSGKKGDPETITRTYQATFSNDPNPKDSDYYTCDQIITVECKQGECCNGVCTDTSSDSQNCGTCGHACPSGSNCVASSCSDNGCPNGQKNCGETCIDANSDCSETAGNFPLGVFPQTMTECEGTSDNNIADQICGKWTIQGDHYNAVWNNGAKATLDVVKWDAADVVITCSDTEGTWAGLTATYEGQIYYDTEIFGKIKKTMNGKTWSETFSAQW